MNWIEFNLEDPETWPPSGIEVLWSWLLPGTAPTTRLALVGEEGPEELRNNLRGSTEYRLLGVWMGSLQGDRLRLWDDSKVPYKNVDLHWLDIPERIREKEKPK